MKVRRTEIAIRQAYSQRRSTSFADISFHYPTAPIELRPDPVTTFGLREDSGPSEYWGWSTWESLGQPSALDSCLEYLAHYIKAEGPFDGAVGFSQGAFAVSLVASLLDVGRKAAFDAAECRIQAMPYPKCMLKDDGTEGIQPQFKFVITSGGKHDGHDLYSAFYDPKIMTNILAFIGAYDPVIDECESLRQAIEYSGLTRIIYHPGGHYFPQQKYCMNEIERFVSDVLDNEAMFSEGLGNVPT